MESSIIYNEIPLTEAFIPTRLLHRGGQIKELVRCLKPLLSNKIPENVFIVGPTGTGKTVVAKWILSTYFKRRSVYVNCWKYKSTHNVLREALLSFEVPIHGRESTSELIKRFENFIAKRKIVVCLDEVDQLKDFDILYILSRSNCGLILISNNHHALMHLDSRIRSRLALTEIIFPSYKPDEIFDIVKDRIKFSFREGAISDELIKIASLLARGDVRIALEIVRRAGRKAEDKNLRRVTIEEIKEAAKEAKRLKKSYLLSKLNAHQRIIYEILEKKIKLSSGELYREYCRRVERPVVQRAYRNYMHRMVELGLIRSIGKKRWKIYEVVI